MLIIMIRMSNESILNKKL